MGGKQSTAYVPRSGEDLTVEEVNHITATFQKVCVSNPGKGCTYDEFVKLCEQIHPLLTQFLVEFYFAENTGAVIESAKEFSSIYACLVRGSVDSKTKVIELLLLRLKNARKKSQAIPPASVLQRKVLTAEVNYDLDEHTFQTRIENYLRGLICSYIKMEYIADSDEFNSWRRVKSKFNIGDIDRMARTFSTSLGRPKSSEDIAKWVKIWKTLRFLHYKVYGHLFGVEDLQVTKTLYPVCVSKHRRNVCLMDMCSIIHLNCQLPPKFRNRWRLLFSSAVHGVNFRHLLEHIVNEGPNLVVIKDKNNHVFGGYASEGWRPCTTYYGNCTAFLFQIQPNLKIYEASGKDDNYQFIRYAGANGGFGMGKGTMNLYGWWIEPERLRGSCALSCSTFQDLPVLASAQNFLIENFEVWGVDDSLRTKHRTGDAAIRYYTLAKTRMHEESNIKSAGKSLFGQTGSRKYTDGYGIHTADQKWKHLEDEEEEATGHRMLRVDEDEEWDEEEDEEDDDDDEDEDEEN